MRDTDVDRTYARAAAGAAVRDLIHAVLANPVTRDRLATAASAVLLACTSEDVSPSDDATVVTLPTAPVLSLTERITPGGGRQQ